MEPTNYVFLGVGTLAWLPFVTGAWRLMPELMLLILAAAGAGGAIAGMLTDELAYSIHNGITAGLYAWAIWKRRPPRKRRESKSLAKIRDLGHRLVTE